MNSNKKTGCGGTPKIAMNFVAHTLHTSCTYYVHILRNRLHHEI